MTTPRLTQNTGRKCQCASCQEFLNSSRAFDRHRTGPQGHGTRRCLTEAEMLALGMTRNKGGWWLSESQGDYRPQGRRQNPTSGDLPKARGE